jgi:hypothetical protein
MIDGGSGSIMDCKNKYISKLTNCTVTLSRANPKVKTHNFQQISVNKRNNIYNGLTY